LATIPSKSISQQAPVKRDPGAINVIRILQWRVCIDPRQPPFFAELTSLEPCEPTELALQTLGKPVMRGVLTVQEKVDLSTEN
jgi:hypothetical protein